MVWIPHRVVQADQEPFWLSFACIIRITWTKSYSAQVVFTAVTEPEKKRPEDARPSSKRSWRSHTQDCWQRRAVREDRKAWQKYLCPHPHAQCQSLKEPAANSAPIIVCKTGWLGKSEKFFLCVFFFGILFCLFCLELFGMTSRLEKSCMGL